MRATTEQAKRAGDIIGRLRAFISKRPANIVSLDLRQAVANALELSEPWLGQSHAQVIIDSTPDELIVRADGVQIEQIVLNLIRNAVEATEHLPVNQRKIFLRLRVVDRSAVLAVRDSGPGITPQARAKLFLPFHTTKESGMGLGLSICQSIAESYGGNIVESSGDTPGADFRLILPLQEENGAAYANH
jgi:C4-dicarboxylate-specific signal transduction histidine kinase